MTKQKCCACSKFRSAKVYFRLAENKNTYELVIGARPGHRAARSNATVPRRITAIHQEKEKKVERWGRKGRSSGKNKFNLMRNDTGSRLALPPIFSTARD